MELSTCFNNVTPLQLPIQDNPVTTGGYGSTKGVAMTIGDPPQFFSGRPAFSSNNIWVTHADYCAGTANYSCIAYYGGIYTPPPGVNMTMTIEDWNGTIRDSPTRDTYYNDNLHVGGRDIPGMPFLTYYYNDEDFTNPAALALGVNSSFVDAATKAGITPNRQWSLWPGNHYRDLDGLLVLGGYDRDRVGGEFDAFELDDLRVSVEITGLSWESKGISTSLMPNGTTMLKGRPNPYMSYISMPQESLDKFMLASDMVIDSEYSYVYPSAIAPTGNLLVTLSNGHNTTIPADDIYTLPHGYNNKGISVIANSSVQRCLVRAQDSDESFLYLGYPFMTQKLFVSDYDHGQFYMADAIKQDLGSKAGDLQPLCTQASFEYPPPTPPKKDGGVNVAAIGGGVGGGVGGLLLIGVVAFFILRRHKKHRKAKDSEALHTLPEVSKHQHQGTPPPKYPISYDTDSPSEQSATVEPLHSSVPTSPVAQMNPNEYDKHFSTTSGDGEMHELESDGRCIATSGPMEMPCEYDHRWN